MTFKTASITGVSALALLLAGIASPASAQDFFGQLFGGSAPQPAAPAPSYGYDVPSGVVQDAPVRHHHARRKVAALDDKPTKPQKPTDIMHDKTLQNGDAVMTKDGLRLYVGNDGDKQHGKDDFAGVDDVTNLPKEERQALIAMDVTRNDPLRGALAPDTIASGRSAAVASPIVPGREIVDARGKTVRYVGP